MPVLSALRSGGYRAGAVAIRVLRRHWRLPVIYLIGCLAWVVWNGPGFGLYPVLVWTNTSLSVPTGRWYYAPKWPPARGDVVVVRDARELGFGLDWLMKRVEGVGGDRFCWHEDEGRHYVNDRPMPPIDPLVYELGVPVWTGCRTLEADEVVGFGEHHLAFTSAHFGPVKHDRLWSVVVQWADLKTLLLGHRAGAAAALGG